MNTIARLGAACAALALPLCPLPAQPAPAAPALTLEEAVRAALAGNLGLLADRVPYAVSQEEVRAEQARFDDWTLAAGADATSRRPALAEDAPGVGRTDTLAVDGALTKVLPTGATASATTAWSWSETQAGEFTGDSEVGVGSVGLVLDQPLLRGAGRTVNLAAVARAEAGTRAARETLKGAVLDVIQGVETGYYNLAYQQARIALQQSAVDVADQLLKEARERERIGLATRVDVLQAQSSLAARQEALIRIKAQAEAASDALLRLLGQLPESRPVRGAAAVSPLPPEPPALRGFEETWQRALRFDPDTGAQVAVIAQREIDRTLAKDRVRPSLSLRLEAVLSGAGDDPWEAARGTAETDGRTFAAGLTYSATLGRRSEKARLRQAELNLDREWYRLAALKEALLASVRTAYRDYETGLERVAAARASVTANEESFQQTRARYQNGLTPFRDVLQAQSELDSARATLLDAVLATRNAAISLDRLDGTALDRHGLAWDETQPLLTPPAR